MRASKKPAKTCANAGAAHVSDKARLRKARQRASLLVKGPTHISIVDGTHWLQQNKERPKAPFALQLQ